MNPEYRKYAPVGLVISGLALMSFIGFFFVRAMSGFGLYTPPNPDSLSNGIWLSLGGIVLGLAITALLDPERARLFLTGRQIQYGSNSLIMLVAFLGILFFVNMLAYENPKSWDLTENQSIALAPETINVLQSLPEPVMARAYYTSRMNPTDQKKLLQKIKDNSNGKFDFEFIDPEFNPVPAQNDGVDRDGTIVLQMGDQREHVSFASEQDIDAALLHLINPQNRVIYFLTGHGERDIQNPADDSLSAVKSALEKKNYTVKNLSLTALGNKIPEDAQAIVIAGPARPLPDAEVTALDTYLSTGGGLVVMEDPLFLTKFGDQPDTLAPLLSKWGIEYNNDMVIDPNSQNPLFAFANPQAYGKHPITAKLTGLLTAFPRTRSLKIVQNNPFNPTVLASTADNAWGETDIQSINDQKVSFDEKTDIAGPMVLAVASQDPSKDGRVVAFGSSEFATDLYYQQGNGDILVNAIDWAANQENLISLTPKNNTQRIYNPPTGFGLIGIILTSLCIIPLLVIAGGITAWASRRRRG